MVSLPYFPLNSTLQKAWSVAILVLIFGFIYQISVYISVNILIAAKPYALKMDSARYVGVDTNFPSTSIAV